MPEKSKVTRENVVESFDKSFSHIQDGRKPMKSIGTIFLPVVGDMKLPIGLHSPPIDCCR